MPQDIELEFQQEADELNPDTFALYLLSLNTLYKAAESILADTSLEDFYAKQDEFLRRIRASVQADYSAYGRLTFDTDSQGFQIVRLVYGSKLKMGIRGAFTALIAAVIINGGEVDLPGGTQIKLRSVGQGMKDIREAVSPAPSFRQAEPPGIGQTSVHGGERTGGTEATAEA